VGHSIRTQTPSSSGATAPSGPTTARAVDTHLPPATAHPLWYTPTARSDLDYVIDLNNGEMTPLPDAIIRSPSAYAWLAETAEPLFAPTRYAVSSDVPCSPRGPGEEGTPQIFIAVPSTAPGASGDTRPDECQVARLVTGRDDDRLRGGGGFGQRAGFGQGNLYVLDVATGESTLMKQGGAQQVIVIDIATGAASLSPGADLARRSTIVCIGLGELTDAPNGVAASPSGPPRRRVQRRSSCLHHPALLISYKAPCA